MVTYSVYGYQWLYRYVWLPVIITIIMSISLNYIVHQNLFKQTDFLLSVSDEKVHVITSVCKL